MSLPIRKPKILLPNKNIDLSKWSVIACDQFTSEPNYWNSLFRYVGGDPSTLYLIYPEAFLSLGDMDEHIEKINRTMLEYRKKGVFVEIDDYVLTIRKTAFGNTRKGLMVLVDLEEYDPFGALSIRATEKTVKERLPVRIKIRQNASIELPHIMVLLDDENREVIEKVCDRVTENDLLYSFTLNSNGGTLEGYRVTDSAFVENALQNVADSHKDCDKASFWLAVGDGNHSLASAKACWENKKASLTKEQAETDLERFALVELVNLYDDGIKFEPIHRVIKNADDDFLKNLDQGEGEEIDVIDHGKKRKIKIKGSAPEIIARVQNYIDEYLTTHKNATQDYIHSLEHTEKVAEEGVAILMPRIQKETFFKYIDEHGVLTRKAFSMGEAEEKRYYQEARIIKN